jgi:hypothetical protein
MSDLTSAMIVNAVVLAAVLEADLGAHRKVGWLRIARPLLLAAGIVPLYLKAFATHGTGLGLEVIGAFAGLLAGVVAASLTHVYRSPTTGKPVSRAGAGYAALWIIVIGGRAAFSYGSVHWFNAPLGHWMARDARAASDRVGPLVRRVNRRLGRWSVGQADAERRCEQEDADQDAGDKAHRRRAGARHRRRHVERWKQ